MTKRVAAAHSEMQHRTLGQTLRSTQITTQLASCSTAGSVPWAVQRALAWRVAESSGATPAILTFAFVFFAFFGNSVGVGIGPVWVGVFVSVLVLALASVLGFGLGLWSWSSSCPFFFDRKQAS